MIFANKSTVAFLLAGSLVLSINASSGTNPTAKTERSKVHVDHSTPTRQLNSFSSDTSSYSSSSQVSSFVSSWQSLSQSFSQCQSTFSQHSSINVATQSLQQLYVSYQEVINQYQSCSACASHLSQSQYTSLIQQSVTEMYSSFQSIISYGQQYYGEQFQSYFASTLQSMSSFASLSEKVCSSAGIDLNGLLSHAQIDLNIFAKIGINVDVLLGGNGDGLLGGVGAIVGRGDHGLVGGILGDEGLVGGILGGVGHGLLG